MLRSNCSDKTNKQIRNVFVLSFVLRSVCLFCVIKWQHICWSHANQFSLGLFAGVGFAEPLPMKKGCEGPLYAVCVDPEKNCEERRQLYYQNHTWWYVFQWCRGARALVQWIHCTTARAVYVHFFLKKDFFLLILNRKSSCWLPTFLMKRVLCIWNGCGILETTCLTSTNVN